MVPVVVFQASRETVQQHPVTKRTTTTQKKEVPRTKKTLKLGHFRRKRGRSTHTNCKKPKLGPKMTRNTTELRDCPQAAFKRSLKDDTGYQYRYTSVTRPLKGTAFLFIDKGGCRGIVMPRSLIFMSTHKATAARCLRYHQATYGQPPSAWPL